MYMFEDLYNLGYFRCLKDIWYLFHLKHGKKCSTIGKIIHLKKTDNGTCKKCIYSYTLNFETFLWKNSIVI